MISANKSGRLATFLFVLGFWVAFIAILEIPRLFLGMIPPKWVHLVWGCFVSIVAFALTGVFARVQAIPRAELGVVAHRGSGLRLALGFAIGFVIVLSQIAAVLCFTKMRIAIDSHATVSGALITLLSLLSIATMEELGFRGYPLRRLVGAFGLWGAQIIVAIAFVLYHHFAFGWEWPRAIIGTGLGSLLFGMAAIASGGLGLAIGIHAAAIFALWAFESGDATGIWKMSWAGPAPTGWHAQVGNASYIGSFLIATFALWLWHRRNIKSMTSARSSPDRVADGSAG
jgi:CAAX protease family protein